MNSENTPHSHEQPLDLPLFWTRLKANILFKLMTMGILLLLSLIPIPLIQDLVHERQGLQDSAIADINQKWAGQQTLTGPILTIPYREAIITVKDKEKKISYNYKNFHILPEQLRYEGVMQPHILYRSIYEMIVYGSELSIQGKFQLGTGSFPVPNQDMLWNKAYLSMGISDLGGIEENIALSWSGQKLVFDPGPLSQQLYASGIHHRVPVTEKNLTQGRNFSLKLKLKGNQRLAFVPVGKETLVKLSSSWKAPSFDGTFLPDQRKVTADGFEAQWKILHLNRNYPQTWSENQYTLEDSAFGVYLLQPVDHYHKTLRSVKYALFFIGLTYLIFFFVEVLTQRPVHPIQYLLVGFALCVFYTLLLSISEHLGFDRAYLMAASMTLFLITAYASGFLKTWPLTLMTGGILTILFGFIYTIIQQEDYALLMGSLGLFIVLALVMFFSRKIVWHQVEKTGEKQGI